MTAEPPRIVTTRLVLRPFRLGDADDVYAYARDPEWARYLEVPQPYERVHAERWVAQGALADPEAHAQFAIELDGRVVGGIGLRFQAEHRRANLGYGIAREQWGRGLVTEAAQALLAWGFARPGVDRVWATADARNGASLRVLEKLGMRREGLLRRHRLTRGELADEAYYGILREEWGAARG